MVSNEEFLSISGFQFKPGHLEEGAECQARSWIPALVTYLSHFQRSKLICICLCKSAGSRGNICLRPKHHVSKIKVCSKSRWRHWISAVWECWAGSQTHLLKQCCAQTLCRFTLQRSSSVLEELQPAVQRLIWPQSRCCAMLAGALCAGAAPCWSQTVGTLLGRACLPLPA